MSTRKTLKDFFQSKGSVQNSISINPSDTNQNSSIEQGDDLGKDFESGEPLLDLDDNTTGLLGDYVSFLMSSYDHSNGTFNGTVSNFYRPGPKNSKAPNSNRGNRSHSPLGSDGNNQVFASENSDMGKTLIRYSNSGYISNLDSIVKKEGSPSNNNLISFDTSKVSNKGETFIDQQINQDAVRGTLETFQGYNRYYTSKNTGDGLAYAEKGEINSSNSSENIIRIYGNLGDSTEITDELRIKNLFNLVPDILQKYTGIKKDQFLNKSPEEIEEIFKNNNSYSLVEKDLKANLQESIPDSIKNDGYQISKNDVIQDERNTSVISGDYSDLANEDTDYLIYLGSVRLKIIAGLISDYFEANSIASDGKKKGYIKKIRGASKISGIIDTTYKLVDCLDEGLFVLFGTAYSEGVKFSEVIFNKNMSESKHFWVAMFRQVIRDSERLLNTLESSNSKEFLNQLSKSRVSQFINMVSRVGDLSLFKTNGGGLKVTAETVRSNVLDVDKLPDNLSTIISKNKDAEGKVAWNQGSTPSLYLMPGNVNSAAMSLGTGVTGANPLRAALSGRLSGETFITAAEGDFAKIPGSLVQELENKLEASYVPFYFHDLRTNEIISFHAFLNQLSDSFTPGYNPVSGYGRMDPVQVYRSTTRSINVGFTVAATSKKDFNEMWWKINKLLTLLYPQWSKGTRVFDEASGNHFTQPFSQIIEASPMIRLRVGDVIKSNYSELALARKFGIGNFDTVITGRPGEASGFGLGGIAGVQAARQILSKSIDVILHASIMAALGSPVANTLLASDLIEYALRGSNIPGAKAVASIAFDTSAASAKLDSIISSQNFQSPAGRKIYNKFLNPNVYGTKVGPQVGDRIIVGITLPDFPYYSADDLSYYHVKTNLTAEIQRNNITIDETGIIGYEVEIKDIDAPSYIRNKKLILRFEDFILSPEHLFLQNLEIFSSSISDFLDNKEEVVSNFLSSNIPGGFGEEIDVFRSLLSSAVFMSPYSSGVGSAISGLTGKDIPTGNPFVKAFNSTKGRGLAGFITSFSIDLMPEDGTWELDYSSRAPKLVKITFGFAPVHDITPGIDHSGFNTAPVYNVGDIMKAASGDTWDSRRDSGKKYFKNSGVVNDK